MKHAGRAVICLLLLLLGACTASRSICRGALRPINVHGALPPEPAP